MEYEYDAIPPQEASEKQPNAPVNILPSVKFEAGELLAAVEEFEGFRIVSVPRPVPCRIFNREPSGTRKRGLKCETCGAQADQGETIVCAK